MRTRQRGVIDGGALLFLLAALFATGVLVGNEDAKRRAADLPPGVTVAQAQAQSGGR